jgi:alpha-amylase
MLNKKLMPLILFILSVFIWTSYSCKNPSRQKFEGTDSYIIENKSDEFQLPEWAKSSVIYEVNLRQYTPEGTINAFSDYLPILKDMGVDILWFMPIHPIGKKNRKGSLGSPYSIANYREVNPEFGDFVDFQNLVQKCHLLGMRVILDWVPNHTAWDHHWITEHPEFYRKDEKGNITDPINKKTGEKWGWTDVAELDFSNIDLQNSMIEEMLFWVKEVDIDGYRMDAAHELPIDFWQKVNEALINAKNDIFLLAEAEEPEHLNEDLFHMAYGWSFHHLMNEIAQGKKKAKDIDSWRVENLARFEKGTLMHFTSNHDENSWNGTEFERMGDAHKALAVLSGTFDGMPLIYSGQEEPLKRRLLFFEKDDIGFDRYEYSSFYRNLNQVKKRNKALWNAEYGGDVMKIVDHDDVYAFKRENEGNKVVVILNLSNQISKFALNEDVNGMKDLFTGKELDFSKSESYYMEPWTYYVGIKN